MTTLNRKKTFSKTKSWILYTKNYEIQQQKAFSSTYSNLFAYAANNPVRYIDPDGNQAAIPSPYGIPIIIPINPVITPDNKSQRILGNGLISNDRSRLLFDNPEAKPADEPSALPNDGTESGKEGYKIPPKDLPGVPDAKPAKPKTPKQGGNSGKRKRWKDSDGNIYEWDYQHGDVEKYNKRGKHMGTIDPETGKQTKPPVNGREVEP